MKKTILYSLALLMGVATLSSCDDYLDTQNKSAGEGVTEHFATDAGLKEARGKAFNSLKSLNGLYGINCQGTDLYIRVRGGDPGDLTRYSLNAENKDVTSFYKNSYSAIQSAEFYKQTAKEGSVEEAEARFLVDYVYYGLTQQFGGVPYIDKYVQDANRVYPRASADSIYTVCEQDLEDIYNANLLPAIDTKSGAVSQQAVATLLAKFYLAHAWDVDTQLGDAARGTYTVNSTANFQKAAEWAVKAIGGQGLTQTFAQKWSPSNEGNPEQIWSIMYERIGYPGNSSEGGHGLQSMFGDYYGPSTQSGYKRVGSNGAQSEKALYLWERGDERYDGTFMTTFYNAKKGDDGNFIWPTTGYYALYKASAKDLATLPYGLRYFPAYVTPAEAEAEFKAHKDKYTQGDCFNQVLAYILSVPAYRYTFDKNGNYKRETVSFTELCNAVNGGTTVRKWDDPDTELLEDISKNDYRNIVVFDLSEVYLMASEAYLMAGNEAEALKYLNAVRTRAKAPALTSFASYQPAYTVPASLGEITPLDVILDERARELYGQFDRWTELRRTKQLVRYNIAFNEYVGSVADMSNSKGEVKWLRPIPADAINGNYGISVEEQNPGY